MTSRPSSSTLLDALAVLWCLAEGDQDAARFLVGLYADDPWPLVKCLAASTLMEVAHHHDQEVAEVLAVTRRLVLDREASP